MKSGARTCCTCERVCAGLAFDGASWSCATMVMAVRQTRNRCQVEQSRHVAMKAGGVQYGLAIEPNHVIVMLPDWAQWQRTGTLPAERRMKTGRGPRP